MLDLSHYTSSFPPAMLSQLGAKPQPEAQPATNAYIYPTITNQALSSSVANFYQYREIYNNKAATANRKAENYNKTVREYRSTNRPNRETQTALEFFTAKHQDWQNAWRYNQEVRKFNRKHGRYLLQRDNIKPLRDTHVNTFVAMVHAYRLQLRKHVGIYKQFRKEKHTLPYAHIHPYEIAHQERAEGVFNLTATPRTIQNHRARLIEAGVLTYEWYHGSSVPVDYYFNPAILVIEEGYNPKTEKTKNQRVSPTDWKNFRDTRTVTRSNIQKENQIKGNVDKSNSCDKERASRSASNLSYKITHAQDGEASPGAAEKDVKTSGHLIAEALKFNQGAITSAVTGKNTDGSCTEKNTNTREPAKIPITEAIETKYDLADKLAGGMYDYYTPVATDALRKIASGWNDKDKFREYVIQDFIKNSASIYLKNTPFAGSWYKAIGKIDSYFGCVNFAGRAMNTEKVISRLKEFRYRLRYAKKWFEKNNWNPRYPSEYFDPLFTDRSFVGFAYTEKVWKKDQKRLAKEVAEKRRRQAEANRRKEDQLNNDRLDRYIYAYLRGEIHRTKLEQKVMQLPVAQRNKFSDRLATLAARKANKIK